MWKTVAGLMFGMLVSAGTLAADLTATEMRWLRGVWPVVAFAKEAGMPLDIVVQPQPTPDVAPLGLAFVEGRCKLVLSMRGNPEADAALERIEPELLDAALELMAAHELGHCRRYLDGAWYDVPAGFADGSSSASSPQAGVASADTRAARREEGYGDLVGLAWAGRHHAAQYARLHAWLVRERSTDRIDGSPHDTLAWVALVQDKALLLDSGSMFAAAALLWTRGLAAGN